MVRRREIKGLTPAAAVSVNHASCPAWTTAASLSSGSAVWRRATTVESSPSLRVVRQQPRYDGQRLSDLQYTYC